MLHLAQGGKARNDGAPSDLGWEEKQWIHSPIPSKRSCLTSTRVSHSAQTVGFLGQKGLPLRLHPRLPSQLDCTPCSTQFQRTTRPAVASHAAEDLSTDSAAPESRGEGPSHCFLGWTLATPTFGRTMYCKPFKSIHSETRMDCVFFIPPSPFYDVGAAVILIWLWTMSGADVLRTDSNEIIARCGVCHD